jgi:hypothetical protein
MGKRGNKMTNTLIFNIPDIWIGIGILFAGVFIVCMLCIPDEVFFDNLSRVKQFIMGVI